MGLVDPNWSFRWEAEVRPLADGIRAEQADDDGEEFPPVPRDEFFSTIMDQMQN